MNIASCIRRYWERLKLKCHVPIFITMVLIIWIFHIFIHGWYCYFFKPNMYIIKVGNIISDMEDDRHGTPWWNRYDCAAARQVVMYNNKEDIATFTWRTHPFFLDQDILYISSPKYKARVNHKGTKVYHQG